MSLCPSRRMLLEITTKTRRTVSRTDYNAALAKLILFQPPKQFDKRYTGRITQRNIRNPNAVGL